MKKYLKLFIFALSFIAFSSDVFATNERICTYEYSVNLNSWSIGSMIDTSDVDCNYDNTSNSTTIWGKIGNAIVDTLDCGVSYVGDTKLESGIITMPTKVHVYVYTNGSVDASGNPSISIEFSDKCEQDGSSKKSKCSTTTVTGFTAAQMKDKNPGLAESEGMFDTLVNKGTCPDAAYIAAHTLKKNTSGNNTICFGDTTTCKSIAEADFSSDTSGFNITINNNVKYSFTNNLDANIDGIVQAFQTEAKEYYKKTEANCAETYDGVIGSDYFASLTTEDEIASAADKHATSAEQTLLAAGKKKLEDKLGETSNAYYQLIIYRYGYLASGGQSGYKTMYDIVAENFTALAKYCKGIVDDDDTLTDEEKEEMTSKIDEETGVQLSKLRDSINTVFASSSVATPTATTEDCEGFLGSTLIPGDPAYYLQLAFNVIKYAGIVLALVMIIIDFVKAVVSQDKDLLQKAFKAAMKRIIYAVIIFFLPILLNFILSLVGAYSTCVS